MGARSLLCAAVIGQLLSGLHGNLSVTSPDRNVTKDSLDQGLSIQDTYAGSARDTRSPPHHAPTSSAVNGAETASQTESNPGQSGCVWDFYFYIIGGSVALLFVVSLVLCISSCYLWGGKHTVVSPAGRVPLFSVVASDETSPNHDEATDLPPADAVGTPDIENGTSAEETPQDLPSEHLPPDQMPQ